MLPYEFLKLEMKAIRKSLSTRTVQTFLHRVLSLFLLGSILYVLYLIVQDILKGTFNVYSFSAFLIIIGILSALWERYAYVGCTLSSVTTLFFIPFIMVSQYLNDFPTAFSVILSAGASTMLTFAPHIILRKRRMPMLGKTFSIWTGYVITVLFLFSLTGRAGVPSTNLLLIDLFALIVLVYICDVALNETYRTAIVQSEIKINIYEIEVFWNILERLKKISKS